VKKFLAVTLLSAASLLAQTPQPQPPPVDPKKAVTPETIISPQQADELFRSMDEVLRFVAKDSGLPIKSPVKRELASRDQVSKYIEEKLNEDEDQKRMERSEIVLKKFGLLPRDFVLREFMIKLLREQVAGFYDSKRKTMYLLNWLPLEAQKPVMSHELTHALQDQTIDIENWMKSSRKKSEAAIGKDNAEVEYDEEVSARSALLEGQGMAVMIDYYLKDTQHSLADSPQIAEAIKGSMSAPDSGSSLLAHAPMLIQEALVFPYRDGLGFVQEVLLSQGKQAAFSGALQRPPRDTHEVLSPKSYLAKQSIPSMQLPDVLKIMGKGWKKYDVGSMGQFDVALILKQFADSRAARELSPAWQGGAYYALIKAEAKNPTTADIALVYVSRWQTEQAASRFAELYSDSFKKRYKDVALKSEQQGLWTSDEGPMRVERFGNELLILESIDQDAAGKLRKAFQSSDTQKVAVSDGDLSMRAVAPVFAYIWH
jgi:hypothetical protein